MAKVKIPKRVGGVKIPKKVRKKAKKAINMTDNESVRDLAAAAIGAARTVRRASRGARIVIDGEPLSATAAVKIDADRLGETIRKAALDGLRSFLEGLEEGLRERGATIDGEAREDAANDEDRGKRSNRRPGAAAP